MNDEETRLRELFSVTAPSIPRLRGFDDVMTKVGRSHSGPAILLTTATLAVVVGLAAGGALLGWHRGVSGQAASGDGMTISPPTASASVNCGLPPRPAYVPSGYVERSTTRTANRSTTHFDKGSSELVVSVSTTGQPPGAGGATTVGGRMVSITRQQATTTATVSASWVEPALVCRFASASVTVPTGLPNPEAELLRVVASIPTVRATARPLPNAP